MIKEKSRTSPDVESTSDEDLVRQAKKGSREAFTILYERYLHAVYNRVRYRVPEADVEDVTQEVFISVMKSLKSFQGTAKFSTWLRTLTDRRIADYYRAKKGPDPQIIVDLSEVDSHLIAGQQAGPGSGTMDRKIMIQRAINELPEHYRDILLLRFAEGLKFKEIAEVLNVSLEAAKSLFRRATEALREQLGEQI